MSAQAPPPSVFWSQGHLYTSLRPRSPLNCLPLQTPITSISTSGSSPTQALRFSLWNFSPGQLPPRLWFQPDSIAAESTAGAFSGQRPRSALLWDSPLAHRQRELSPSCVDARVPPPLFLTATTSLCSRPPTFPRFPRLLPHLSGWVWPPLLLEAQVPGSSGPSTVTLLDREVSK